MSCVITYKGNQYSEQEFKKYFNSNTSEFIKEIANSKNVIDSFKNKIDAINYVFQQAPELESIGTKTQYLKYLSTIFPNSKVKDIVYHGVIKGREIYNKILNEGFDFKSKRNWDSKNSKFKEGDNTGMFFSDYNTGQSYGLELTHKINENGEYEDVGYNNVISAILNIKYLDTSKETSSRTAADFYKENKNKDAIGMFGLEGGSEGVHWNHVVFESEQIHILGSKQDIEGFKKFKNSSRTNVKDARADLKTEIDNFTVYPSFLNIRNMIEGVDYLEADHEIGNITIPMDEYEQMLKKGQKEYGLSEQNTKLIIAFYQNGNITKGQAELALSGEESLSTLLNADGYWYVNKYEHKGTKSYVVFNTDNIKSLHNNGEYTLNSSQMYKQSAVKSSAANPITLEKFKEWATRLGLKGNYLNNMVVNGVKYSANGIADIANSLYYVLNGQEATSEPEEITHFTVEALEESYPKLFNEMLGDIAKYPIYRDVLEQYKEDKDYQKDGKPDIRKIKKEAIAKLLVEMVIKKEQGTTDNPELIKKVNSWWERIKEWFNNLIKRAGFNPFEAAIEKFDKLNPIQNKSNEKYAQLSDKQEEVVNKLLEIDKTLQKISDPEPAKGEDKPARYKVLEGNTWREIWNSVTDRANAFVNKIPAFRNKVFTEAEEEMNLIYQEYGNQGHSAFQDVLNRYFDNKGNYRQQVLPKTKNPILEDKKDIIYNKIEGYVNGLIKKYGKDSVFLSEKSLYDPTYKTKKGLGEAGTADLIIIEPSGRTSIYDWKFMQNTNKSDIASYKQGKYNIQIQRYQDILRKQYGITNFGEARAIPILFGLKRSGDEILFKDISIGNVDPKEEEITKLLPIPIHSERTGNEEINNLIDKLNNLYKKVEGEKVDQTERANKIERLNIIRSTIRKIQVKEAIEPLYDAMFLYLTNLNSILSQVDTFRDNDKSEAEVNDFTGDLNDIYNMIGFYSSVTHELQNTLDESSPLYEKMSKLQDQIGRREAIFKNIYVKFGDKEIGEANNVFGLMDAEKSLGNMAKIFQPADWMDKTAIKTLVNLYNKAAHKAVKGATSFNETIFPIIQKIAKKAGNQFKLLIKPGTNQLIDEFDSAFFETFKRLKEEDNKKPLEGKSRAQKFIEENIDVKGYSEEAAAFVNEKTKEILARSPQYVDAKEEQWSKEQKIKGLSERFKLSSESLTVNHILQNHINRDKWLSKEYKALDSDLREFFHKFQELNSKAEEIGYITYYQKRTFLPFINKQGFEKIGQNGWNILKMPFDFIDSLNSSERAHFGYTDNISGKKRYSLSKPYTMEVENPSEELGQSILLYAQAIYKYEAMREIEEQVELVSNLEKNKGHLETTNFGDVMFDENGKAKDSAGNDKNWQYFDNLVQFLLYGNRYPMSNDQSLGVNRLVNLLKRGINKLVGREIVKEGDTPVSMIKVIDALNRFMRLKTLGLSPMSGAVNWFGGNMQALAQGGDYYRPKDFFIAQTKLKYLLSEKYWGDAEKDVFLKMISVFQPLTESSTYNMFGQASTSSLGKVHLDKVMYTFMQSPEIMMQVATFHAFMQNTMVVNGRLVNINEYYRKQNKDRYSSAEKIKEYEKTATAEIEKLKEEKSILKTAKIENGELVIPELTNKKDIEAYGVLSKGKYKKLTGAMSETSVNGAKMEVFLNSAMVFKNWIPKLAYTRFAGIHKTNDGVSEEKYEIGRITLMLNVLFDKALFNVKAINDMLKANNKGLAKLDELYLKYAEKYKKSTGKDFTMDKDDFKDMIRQSLKNEILELQIMISFFGAMFGLGFVAPPDDDKQSKAALQIIKRTLDQFSSELEFYYNPLQLQKMLSGSTFPALGLFSDIDKFLTHTQRELTGVNMTNYFEDSEDVRKNATPAKYALKLVPGANAWLKYLEMISPDAADYLGIKTPPATYSR